MQQAQPRWRGILNCGRVHKEAEDKQAEHETEQAAPQLSFHGDSRKQCLSIQLDFGRNQPEPCSPLNSPSSLCNAAPYRRQEARIALVRLPESRRGCEIKDLSITLGAKDPPGGGRPPLAKASWSSRDQRRSLRNKPCEHEVKIIKAA
jgi:hypothetical protein